MTDLIIKAESKRNPLERNVEHIAVFLIAFTVLSVLFGNVYAMEANKVLDSKIEEAKLASKPDNLNLVILNCDGCYDLSGVLESIKSQNVNITGEEKLDFNEDRAKELISSYKIERLPTVLIFREEGSNKTTFNDFYTENDALVLNDSLAPYFDVSSGEIRGAVKIIELDDSSCGDCVSLSPLVPALVKLGVSVKNSEKVEYSSAEGRSLLVELNITQVPSILISKEIDYYPNAAQLLKQAGASKKGEYYLLHSTIPPYRNLTSNKIMGLVDLILINDSSCKDCYDVNLNKVILSQMGMAINSEKTYDISSSEAKTLISKYSINKVPMIILSSEASAYPGFVDAWSQVGTVEPDGNFVMRTPEVIGNVTAV